LSVPPHTSYRRSPNRSAEPVNAPAQPPPSSTRRRRSTPWRGLLLRPHRATHHLRRTPARRARQHPRPHADLQGADPRTSGRAAAPCVPCRHLEEPPDAYPAQTSACPARRVPRRHLDPLLQLIMDLTADQKPRATWPMRLNTSNTCPTRERSAHTHRDSKANGASRRSTSAPRQCMTNPSRHCSCVQLSPTAPCAFPTTSAVRSTDPAR
jgi:hypothetical protein